jgi:cytochrome c551/c552
MRIIAAALVGVAAFAAQASIELAGQKGCLACHSTDKAMYGPAFRAIAEMYKDRPDAAASLTKKIINGGAGVWGTAAMPPNALTSLEASALAAWVLSGVPATGQKAPHKPASRASAAVRPIVPEQMIHNGRYLVEHVMGCGNCHAGRTADTKVIPGMELAGGRVYDLPQFFAQPGNLTSDNETGIGRWSLAELTRAITHGVRPNGIPLAPMMPSNFYKALTPEDAQSVAAYLAIVPPVYNLTAPAVYRQSWTVDRYPDSEIRFDARQMAKDKMLRGRYLAALAHCLDCHTPIVDDRANFERDGGKGGRRFGVSRVLAPNITSHATAGIGAWSDTELRNALFSGKGRDGRVLQYPMAWPYLSGLTRYDQDSLVAWLRSLPARE